MQMVSLLFAPGPRCSASGSVWTRRTVCVAASVATLARAVRTRKVDSIPCPWIWQSLVRYSSLEQYRNTEFSGMTPENVSIFLTKASG